MKKDILILANFCSEFDGSGNGRFNYIAKELSKYNVDVELVTSDFSHILKTKRKERKADVFKITLLREPPYDKNISLKGIYSHHILSKNLSIYLKERKRPDVIYCAVPSLDFAYVAAKYAKKNSIKFIIDVQDLWPEAFKIVFNVPIVSDFIYDILRKKADSIYESADCIIAVSQTYVERAMKVNKKCTKGYPVFLGTDLENFDDIAKESKIKRPDDEIWIAYIGTLGHSYDLFTVIDALKLLKEKYGKLKFIVMGDGPLKNEFETYAENSGIYYEFTGNLDYSDMVSKLVACDIAVNPIKKGAAQSIINKVGDYAAAGLPVVNTQECEEYRNLVTEYDAGINCGNGDVQQLSEAIERLAINSEVREKMGANNRHLAEEKFDRQKTYPKLVKFIAGGFA